jgi:ubiquinone/menaquinone biosynthesis C-methylase UbiE
MNFKELQNNWNKFGKQDPLWAIITCPEKKGGKWKLDEFFELGTQEIESVMEFLKTLGAHIQRRRALDFGCGVGRISQALANYFDEVCGVDIAPSMVKLARKYNRHSDRCKYYLNEADNLKLFPGDSFDFIYTIIVLQHMLPSYARSYIKEFLRVLTPGGILMFQLPSEKTPQPTRYEPQPSQTEPEDSNKLMTGIKQFIKRLTPGPLIRWYIKVRYADKSPVMEMHCIKREEVVSLLKENDAEILDIMDDQASGPSYVSFRYTVTKTKPSAGVR